MGKQGKGRVLGSTFSRAKFQLKAKGEWWKDNVDSPICIFCTDESETSEWDGEEGGEGEEETVGDDVGAAVEEEEVGAAGEEEEVGAAWEEQEDEPQTQPEGQPDKAAKFCYVNPIMMIIHCIGAMFRRVKVSPSQKQDEFL